MRTVVTAAAFGMYGTLAVSNSTFIDNSALYGGGVFNDEGAMLTVNNSTFTHNTAYITNYGSGGGISNYGTMIVKGTLSSTTPAMVMKAAAY